MSRHPRTPRTLPAVGSALLLGVLVAGAPGAAQAADPAADTADTADTAGTPPGTSWVRLGQFVPGMGSTTIDLEPTAASGEPVDLDGDAAYGDVSAYEGLPPGGYTATVRESAASPDAEPLLSRSFDVTAGEARTVAVVGTPEAPRLVLLTDDLDPPSAGSARVRLLTASPTAPEVSVEAVDGPVIAEDAVLGQATEYATVPAGDWTLQLSSESASSTLQDVPIASGSVYTVVVLDAPDAAGSVELRVISDAAGAATAPRGGAATGGGGTAVLDRILAILLGTGR